MIVYLANKSQFHEDILSNRIEEIVHESFQRQLGKSVGASELASWKNSLGEMDRILGDDGIPHNAGVAIEFNIPQTGKRVDFIITGTRQDRQRTAVIVELKQWQEAKATPMDGIVSTFVGGREREVNHPSYQAWAYAMLIEDFNETVRQDPIHLRPCAYMHNCASGSVIHAPFYAAHTKLAPAFLRDDAKKLREFIKAHVKYGDDGETMYRIRDGKLRPSKNLADHLASLIQGNREFYLIDEQKTVYETALHLARSSSATNKNVLIVNGGPGTGKTVVAINLLVELTAEKTFRGRGGDFRPDAFSYCLGALQRFEGMPKPEIQKISFEIAMLGTRGLDVNDPAQKYSLNSIPGKFSGLHLFCIEYVGFQLIDPSLDLGFDLSAEYAEARKVHGKR